MLRCQPVSRAKDADIVFGGQNRAESAGVLKVAGNITAAVQIQDDPIPRGGRRDDPFADEMPEDNRRVCQLGTQPASHQQAEFVLSGSNGFNAAILQEGFEKSKLRAQQGSR